MVEAPAPVCNLIGFGDSSVDFDLRFWIRDPANGIANENKWGYQLGLIVATSAMPIPSSSWA